MGWSRGVVVVLAHLGAFQAKSGDFWLLGFQVRRWCCCLEVLVTGYGSGGDCRERRKKEMGENGKREREKREEGKVKMISGFSNPKFIAFQVFLENFLFLSPSRIIV